MLDITKLNQRFIYILSFETTAILARCFFFIHMNVKKHKLKIRIIQQKLIKKCYIETI